MILITGHRGYIGSNLVKSIPNHIGIDLKEGKDLLTCELPTDVSTVIHLAGYSNIHGTYEECFRANLEATRRLLNNYRCRTIVASSSCAREPYLNPYGMSKYVAESIPHDNVVHMRFTNVFGNGHRDGSLHNLYETGKLKYVTEHIRDFVHVDDVCNKMLELIDSDTTGIIDVGSGSSKRICDMFPGYPIKEGYSYEMKDNSI